jgi:threonine dehydratase
LSALPGREDVLAARDRLRGTVLETGVAERASVSDWVGCSVFFKCENQQRSGSFKYRGASNAVFQLDDTVADAATHSSGNHGAALALAARNRGIRAHVVMPAGANPKKREAVIRYGGRVVDSGETLAEREAALETVLEETGAACVPPYDHPHVIAGQGTAALEFASQVPDLDELWVPVGGGGLASGSLLALSDSPTRVVGVEPELADDAFWSLEKGELQPQRPPKTIADGLRTALGSQPFEIFRRFGLRIVTVSEAEIESAQRAIWERLKLVVEPSGAAPLAGLVRAVRSNPGEYTGKRVGVILSGGNALYPV